MGCLLRLYLLLNLRVIPWTRVRERTSSRAITLAAQARREVLFRDLREQRRLVVFAEDVDLRDSHFVKPWLDERPDGRKQVWRVDDVKFPHALRISILANAGRLRDIILDLVELAQADVVEIENRARRLHRVSNLCAACRKSLIEELFVLQNEPLQ